MASLYPQGVRRIRKAAEPPTAAQLSLTGARPPRPARTPAAFQEPRESLHSGPAPGGPSK